MHHIRPFERNPDEVATEETGNEGVDAMHFYHDAIGSAISTPWKASPADIWRLQSSCNSTLNWNAYLLIYKLTTLCDGSIELSEDLKVTQRKYAEINYQNLYARSESLPCKSPVQIRRRV